MIDRPQGAPFYVFVYYRSPCVFEHPCGTVACQGQFILLQPGVAHHYHSGHTPYMNDWVHFDVRNSHGRQFMHDLHLPYNTLIPLADSQPIGHAVKSLQALGTIPGQWQQACINAHLVTLLTSLASQLPQQHNNAAIHPYYAPLCALQAQLHQMPLAGISVQTLASNVGLSVSRFHHVYKQLFQRTVGQDIANARLQRAKYLLQNSAAPLSVVAQNSGYTNQTHLCRQFRQHMGMTPGQYRRMALP